MKNEFKIWASACFLICLALINSGSMRKNQDPILDTQTSGILHKDKMEEIKDGEKGAPTPSFNNYEKTDFLTEPVVTEEKPSETDPESYLPKAGDVIPENLVPDEAYEAMGNTPDEKEDDWWTEEQKDVKKSDANDESYNPDEPSQK